MNEMFQIAIDGPVSSGKSSVGRLIAEALDFCMLDTGILYRAIAWQVLHQYDSQPHESPPIEKIVELLEHTVIQVNFKDREAFVLINGIDITKDLFLPQVSELTAKIAQIPYVRTRLVSYSREAAEEKNIVMVGRDIGSVVLPYAQVKIFLSATPEERARRRFEEYISRGVIVSYEDVYKDLLARDETDTTRAHSPLAKASDAVLIDTTNLSLKGVVDEILSLVNTAIDKTNKC